ncbi:glycosyltransferase family 4 protein [Halanaerobacter jeridensis]|uniref:1,2-diacylglycerol 3-alpha-glucosyltransferase n=1 Tax=Halanaerobacter jeridensis TaxID=706427 RepID=A0A939BMJ5_9FIRM|nr:glycosyltransferase family 4 protein [Halanaerobacter jeridensis]MBM7556700.1 1,2-diacylglycerol 3-alpha-glucosyltransferase [Halanaerobacter jeridensis]
MNIGIFMDTYEPQVNGVVTSTKMLKDELEKLGHQVTIITINDPRCEKESEEGIIRLSSFSVPLIPEQRLGVLKSYKIIKKIKDLDLDLIHTQTEFSVGLLGRFIAKVLDLPVVHTYHTMYEDYMHYITGGKFMESASKLAQKITKLYCKNCDQIIAPTDKVKEALTNYGVEDKIQVVPTGIKLTKFKKENYQEQEVIKLKESLGIDKDDPVVLYIGRLAEEKSIDVIIEQFPQLLEELPEAKFLIVGDGPSRDKLEQLSQELGIAEAVVFAGEQPWEEIGKYYQLGDAFVSASTTETQGLTFVEAMAAEVPVVAKYDKNLENMIQDEVNGRVFKEDNELPALLVETLSNEIKTKQLVKQAYEDAQELSAEQFAKKVESLYYKVIAGETSETDDKIWVM